jgi:hypothetical protein
VATAGLLLSYLGLAYAVGMAPFGKPDVRVDVAASSFNPVGDDDPADEFVCLVNEGDDVELTGWELRDAIGVVNELRDFTLRSGESVRVHPGGGRDTEADIYGDRGGAAWTNEGDTVTLVDDDGNEIDSKGYGPASEGAAAGCGDAASPSAVEGGEPR